MSWFKRSRVDGAGDGPVAGAAPEVEPLTADEVSWVASTIAGLAEQGVRTDDLDDLGRYYDEMLTGWLRLKEGDRPDPDGIVHPVGLALGQHVADHTGLGWRIALATTGPEIALWRADDALVVYPVGLVARSWAAHETRVLPALGRALIQSVGRTPASPS